MDQINQITLSDEIITKISQLCSEDPLIEAAYIFGSTITGKKKRSKDIDIALLIKEEGIKDFSILSFISFLERICRARVDVVILNNAGEVLKYEVRRNGYLIFERDPEKRKKFEIKGRKTYQDFLHLHRIYVDTVLYGKR
jgi:hypothetical protein